MICWNFAEAIYQWADSPAADRPALIHEDRVISYAQLRDRACGIASWMRQLALPAGAHVGHYLRNSNAYMETRVVKKLMRPPNGSISTAHPSVLYSRLIRIHDSLLAWRLETTGHCLYLDDFVLERTD